MNSDLMRWLLDLDVIPSDAQSLRLAWEHPWPRWVWAILFITAGFFAIWSYHRLSGHRVGRGILAATRFVILILALVLVSGPMLELPRETVEQDWVLVLADRSASMTIKDAAPPPGTGTGSTRVSRDAQLEAAIEASAPVLADLADDRHLVWLGFHVGAFNLSDSPAPQTRPDAPSSAQSEDGLPSFGDPTGRRTNIDAALEQALQRAAARPVSGVVLFSDGRTDSPPSRTLVRRLQADAIPVFVVPLGSPDPLGDLAIRRVDAPRRAFIRDKVPVVVELDRLGSAVRDLGGSVRLIDQSTGQELDRVTLAPGLEQEQITLTAEPQLAGEVTWQVVVEPSASAPGMSDLIPENNFKPFQIELVDRPLRVLYVEGYPRWEYRYVKELIRREKSMESSVMLISADRDFAQEGNIPISRLPRSPEEFASYDVVILGDVPATFFSPEQLDMMRDHVADRGAGLLWIAGERYTPASYVGQSLADLLPMRGSLNLPQIGQPITMTPTPLAERLGVLRLAGPELSASSSAAPAAGEITGWPAELADPATGWSQLFWAQKIEPGNLKPAAEILAQTVDAFSGTHLPLVLSMRYGSGQSMYVATDETWRWRYGRGELYPDQFWVQMIRMLGRESLTNAGDPATLEVNPRRLATGQPLRIELRLLDAQLVQEQRPTIHVKIQPESGPGAADSGAGGGGAGAARAAAEIELRKIEGTEDRYAATYLPDTPGQYLVRIDEPALATTLRIEAPVEVFSPDDELRRPETDHPLLASLAAETGGRVLATDELDQLPELLPNRAVITVNPLTEPIWDTPLAFILVLLALTGEWIGRKVIRLV